METIIRETITDDLIADEGYRRHPYKCTAGKLTIGYGRNLDDVGISEQEAQYLLHRDINACEMDMNRIFDEFDSMPDSVKRVLINMRF
ncbi:MAG: lysozyme, partial [Desulfamplus sp.]|nr:lysozyme [Desulfamplus sp.]